MVENINDNQFFDCLKNNELVLVDFWAEWCGPCKMLAPILNDVAEEFVDELKIVKIDVDKNSEMSEKYGVRGIPTMMLFKNMDCIGTKVGVLSKAQLIEFINNTK